MIHEHNLHQKQNTKQQQAGTSMVDIYIKTKQKVQTKNFNPEQSKNQTDPNHRRDRK